MWPYECYVLYKVYFLAYFHQTLLDNLVTNLVGTGYGCDIIRTVDNTGCLACGYVVIAIGLGFSAIEALAHIIRWS